jgi:hypothetical protein
MRLQTGQPLNYDTSQQEGIKSDAFRKFELKTLKSVYTVLSEYPELVVQSRYPTKNKSEFNYAVRVPNSSLLTQIVFELPDDSLTTTDFSSRQFVSQIEMAQNVLAKTLSEIDLNDGIRDIRFTLNADGTVDFKYGKNEVQKLGASDTIPIEGSSEIDYIKNSDLMRVIKSMPQAADCDIVVRDQTVIVSYTHIFNEDLQRNVKISIPEELFDGDYEDNSRIPLFLKGVVGGKILSSITKPEVVEVNIVIDQDWNISL